MDYIYVSVYFDNFRFYREEPNEKLKEKEKTFKIGVDDAEAETINLMVRVYNAHTEYHEIYHVEESSLASFTEKVFRILNQHDCRGTFNNDEKKLSIECDRYTWIFYKNIPITYEDDDDSSLKSV